MSSKPIFIVDSQEVAHGHDWKFVGYQTKVTSCLKRGYDYSLYGYMDWIGVERKSVADWIGRTGSIAVTEKFRKNQLDKLIKLEAAAIIVEGSPNMQFYKSYGPKLNPQEMIDSASWIMSLGIPVLFAGSAELAERACIRFLLEAKKRMDEK